MIWDLHCHLSGVPGNTPDERMARLLAYADRFGIERLCMYMGMILTMVPKPDDFRRQNDQILEALRHWSQRAFGFVYLNPRYVKESLDELDRCVRDGPMVGVKLWVALAARHPDATLICGHTGGDWERGIRVIRPYKNVTSDLAGSDPTSGYTEMAVRELGADRVLYGSDVGGRSFASQLAKVKGANIPEEAKRLILGENLRRLLTPILQAKGVKP